MSALDALGAAPVVERRSGSIAGRRSRIASAERRAGGCAASSSAGGDGRSVGFAARRHRRVILAARRVPPARRLCFGAMRSKDQVRRAVWRAMDREGVSRFPGAEGRIPNFAGAKLAAQKLAGHRLWKPAEVIKANPDSPQTHARRLALEQGKKIVMAVPRLRDQHPFRLLDPKRLTKAQVREAATIKGALRHGKVVALEEIPEIDFVLCGSVAVNLSGAGRKGGRILRPRVRDADRRGQDRRPHPGRDHGPPDPDPARTPDGHRPRPAGRPDRHPAGGDRGRADYKRPRASSGTTCNRPRSTRSRSWSGWVRVVVGGPRKYGRPAIDRRALSASSPLCKTPALTAGAT